MMLTSSLIHPEIIGALASAGHGSRVAIVDANYPHSTAVGPRARMVHLNLIPGTVDAVTVLRALLSSCAFEAAEAMAPQGLPRPAVHDEFESTLKTLPLTSLPRKEFYDAMRSDDLALVIATGETRLYGNLLLTIAAIPRSES